MQERPQDIIKIFDKSVIKIANNFKTQNPNLQIPAEDIQEMDTYAENLSKELASIEKTNAAKYQALYNYFSH